MGQGQVPYAQAALAIERILMAYSDKDHPITLKDIQDKLEEQYKLRLDKKPIKRLLQEMVKCPPEKGPVFTVVEMENAYEVEVDGKKEKRKYVDGKSDTTNLYYMREGVFQDFEINYLSDVVSSAIFLRETKSNDLINRLQCFQSEYKREDRKLYRGNFEETVKPTLQTVFFNLELLNDAITKKETVKFTYHKYVAKPQKSPGQNYKSYPCKAGFGDQPAGVPTEYKHLSPYRLQYMDSHYFVLTNNPLKEGSSTERCIPTAGEFLSFRLDLIGLDSLKLEGSDLYVPLVNQDAPKEYYRGAVNGFGGTSKLMVMRCDKFALHYIIGRYLDYKDFSISQIVGEPKLEYEVKFMAYPRGIAYWASGFADHIEVLEPKEARDIVIGKLKRNVYGL